MILNLDDVMQMEQRYRAAFINSLAGFRQAVLIGTKSIDGIPDLLSIVFEWVSINEYSTLQIIDVDVLHNENSIHYIG